LAIVNSAAIASGYAIASGVTCVTFLWVYLQEWDCWTYGRSVYRFLRRLQVFFQSGCISLYSYQQCMRVSFSPHPCQYPLLGVFNDGYSNGGEVES
jgi:hypothetical protein